MAAPSLPGPLDIEIGTDWVWSFSWEVQRRDTNGVLLLDDTGLPLTDPVDLSGYGTVTARMQVRDTIDSPIVLLELTSAPSEGITVTPSTATFTASLSKEAIDAMAWTRAVFDFFVSLDGADKRLIGESVIQRVKAVTHD